MGVAADEIRAAGFAEVQPGRGGVRFEGSALRANRVLAIPSRVYARVARFKCFTFEQLEAGVRDVDLSRYGGLAPKASCRASRLYHTAAVCERVARHVTPGATELLIRIDRNRCTLSVDTSGERLHRRGWRIEGGAAPLRETLAAGMLALAGWKPGTPLIDPMCGSGTLLVEAAVAAAGRAPGGGRRFPCECWLDPEPMPKGEAVATRIVGRDQSQAAVSAARNNAERAGVELELAVGRAREATALGAPGLLITNPPYGRRAKGAATAFDELGALLTGPFADWKGAVLCAERTLESRLGREVVARYPLKNGGLKVELLVL